MFIKKWLKKRKEKAERKEYKRGYDYAAGALLRGEETPLSIEAHYFRDDWTFFEDGANDAVTCLIAKGVVKNDNS